MKNKMKLAALIMSFVAGAFFIISCEKEEVTLKPQTHNVVNSNAAVCATCPQETTKDGTTTTTVFDDYTVTTCKGHSGNNPSCRCCKYLGNVDGEVWQTKYKSWGIPN